MSLKNIKSNTQDQKGFTIVELLIVVVVIAILAAITIVSYNGITSRANASAAASLASGFQKKIELFAADGPTNTYPRALTDITGATAAGVATAIVGATPAKTSSSSDTWYLAPATIAVGTPSASNGKTTIIFTVCGNNGVSTTAPTTIAGMTNISGATVQYFDYEAGTGTKTVSAGTTTPTSGVASARGCVVAGS